MRLIASILTLSLFTGWASFTSGVKAIWFGTNPEELLLIQNMSNHHRLPRNFRSALDDFIPERSKKFDSLPTRKGLDKLSISGSSQFSEKGLEAILKLLPNNKNLVVVDLRQESHGFLNGIATSWYGKRDWANIDKSPEQINSLEMRLLEKAWLDGNVILYSDKTAKDIITLDVNSIGTEHELLELTGVEYKRFYITDHTKPSDDDVESFIAFVNGLSDDTWLHFHCAAGKGRTTTFMAMYDILKNANEVSFDTIIARQWLLGGLDLSQMPKESDWKYPYIAERYEFLKNFYKYAHQNPHATTMAWKQWIKEQSSVVLR